MDNTDPVEANTVQGQASIPLLVANQIQPTSWLNDHKYEWFVMGYDYAATQTRAIPVLAKVKPEELYFAVWAIIHRVFGRVALDMESGQGSADCASNAPTLLQQPLGKSPPISTPTTDVEERQEK